MTPSRVGRKQGSQPSPADFNALLALYNAGRYAEAESRAHTLLERYPGAGSVWKLLGILLHMQGKDPLAALQKTAQLLPEDAGVHFNLGSALQMRGQLQDAARSYRLAVKFKPDFAMAHNNLGNVLIGLAQFDAAAASYRKAVQLQSDLADAHNNLGIALKALGQLEDAVSSYRRAVKLKPDFAMAHNNLGDALNELGEHEAAAASCRRAVELNPDLAEAHNNLGNALKDLGQPDAAVASYRRAVELKPGFAMAHSNLGNALYELGQLDAAAASCRRALEIDPDYAEAHTNLGNALKDLGQLEAAADCYRRALELKPGLAVVHSNLGIALKDLGQYEAAIASYRRALELKPDLADAYSGMLFSLNYTAQLQAYCVEEARKYGRMVSGKVTARYDSWQCAESPQRLRVGMVSGDLHNHPVGYFVENLLANLDPARIELIAYPTHHKEDDLTVRVKPRFAAWRPLVGLADEAAARLIHDDRVHVLLDLSGHTGRNRLPVFAWKPAPVQVTWLGYFATTGMAEMDYILGDKWTLPDGEAQHFVEKGWRLADTLSCLTPPKEDIEVETLPALQNRYVTFGTLNNSAKMNERVVACWARILNRIPDSRLYLNMSNLRDHSLRKSVTERYAKHGVAEDRLILDSTAGRVAALNSYNKMDIALDPFPYPGGTTSYEALWMGVPVLTMQGDNFISHLGESIMHNAGLHEWIASNEDDYVAKAIAFSGNPEDLAALRGGLRARVLASPLFDARRFAKSFEDALWGMWQAQARAATD